MNNIYESPQQNTNALKIQKLKDALMSNIDLSSVLTNNQINLIAKEKYKNNKNRPLSNYFHDKQKIEINKEIKKVNEYEKKIKNIPDELKSNLANDYTPDNITISLKDFNSKDKILERFIKDSPTIDLNCIFFGNNDDILKLKEYHTDTAAAPAGAGAGAGAKPGAGAAAPAPAAPVVAPAGGAQTGGNVKAPFFPDGSIYASVLKKVFPNINLTTLQAPLYLDNDGIVFYMKKYYFNLLIFDYVTKNININVTNLIKYSVEKFKNSLNKTNNEVGFIITVLYDYDDSTEYNLDKSLVNNKSITNRTYFYYDKNTGEVENNFINEEIIFDKDKRRILSRKQLSNINNIYNKYYKELLITFKTDFKKYKTEQLKYLMVVSWLIQYDEYTRISMIEKQIHEQFNLFIKKIQSGVQTQTTILKLATSDFSEKVYELNNELLKIIGSRNKLQNVIKDYNEYILKYSLWVLYILDQLGTFSNDNQEMIFERILSIYLSADNVKKWIETCKSNQLNYYLPVKAKIKGSFGNKETDLFLNIITGKTIKASDKKRLNNFVIVKPRTVDISYDKTYYYWDNETSKILMKDPFQIVSVVLRGYLKSITEMDLEKKSFFVKSMNDLCSTNSSNMGFIDNEDYLKEKIKLIQSNNNINTIQSKINNMNKEIAKAKTLRENCKNFISFEDIIQEIVKSKYSLDISPATTNSKNSIKLKSLQTSVKKFQSELVKSIKMREKYKNI